MNDDAEMVIGEMGSNILESLAREVEIPVVKSLVTVLEPVCEASGDHFSSDGEYVGEHQSSEEDQVTVRAAMMQVIDEKTLCQNAGSTIPAVFNPL